jgi:hypothetical protein
MFHKSIHAHLYIYVYFKECMKGTLKKYILRFHAFLHSDSENETEKNVLNNDLTPSSVTQMYICMMPLHVSVSKRPS